jgi:hypothetical protein
LTIVRYEEGNAESEAKARALAEDLQSGNVVIAPYPRGQSKATASIERVEPSQVGSQVLIDIVDRFFEQKIERLFVGQTMSASSEGHGLGGTGVADLHADTKYQLVTLDAANLDETLTDDLVKPLMDWNVPGADFRLKFVSDLSKPDPTKQLDAVNKAYAMGVDFVADEVRQLTGMSKPTANDQTISKAQEQAAQSSMMGPAGMGPGGGPPGGPMGPGGPPSGGPGGGGAGAAMGGPGQPSPGMDAGGAGGDDPADAESSPEIQSYFLDAIHSGQLFDPAGLRRLKNELESGGWRWSMSRG